MVVAFFVADCAEQRKIASWRFWPRAAFEENLHSSGSSKKTIIYFSADL